MIASKYDYIVVGAGPAGLMWAHETVGAKKQVLLIDSGEYEDTSYSAIDLPLEEIPGQGIGGIGGVAKAWQGQCISFTADEFNTIFSPTPSWNFQTYNDLEPLVSRLLGIKMNHKVKKMAIKILNKAQLPNNTHVRFSYIPNQLDWSVIFKKTLRNKKLEYIEKRATSVEHNLSFVTAVRFSDGSKLEFGQDTKVILATGPRNVSTILKESEESKKDFFPNVNSSVFDHPWRTFLRFETSRHKILRKNTFKLHFGFSHKMRSKVKFEVFDQSVAIGAFELRPVYKGSIFYKAVARISLKIFRISVLSPRYVDVWAQIAQSEPIRVKLKKTESQETNEIDLGLEDRRRLKLVEDTVRNLLNNMNLNETESKNDPNLHQAFHPSGNISLGTDPLIYSFDTNLKSNSLANLYIAGASGFKNCSWINPTFSVLLHSMNNARLSLKSPS